MPIIYNNNLFRVLIIFFILVFFCHFIFISFLYPELGTDNAYWHYLGWNWYNFHNIQEINLIENKPPGMMFLYYLSSKFYDVNFLPLKILFILIKITTGLLIYKICGLITNQKEIQLYTLLMYFLLLGWKQFDSYQPVYSEVITSFVSTLSIYVYIKFKKWTKYLFLGFFFSIGFFFKQTSLVFFMGFLYLIYYHSQESRYKNILIVSISFLVSFLLIFIFFIYLGLNFEGIVYQITNVLSVGTDTVAQISSRIKLFLIRWTGPERVFLFFSIIYFVYFFLFFTQNKLAKSLCVILALVGMGAHAVGTITGHQLIESIPVFLILFSLILYQIYTNVIISKNNPLLILMILILFFPPINLQEYKENLNNFSFKDKVNPEIKEIKQYVDKFITNPFDTIYVHERDSELILQLKKRSASNFFNTTFLYQSYDKGQPRKKEIENVINELKFNKPKMIIFLDSYKNEAPYLEKINFFDEVLANYRLDKKMFNYNFYIVK
jgi:hypothetical protein